MNTNHLYGNMPSSSMNELQHYRDDWVEHRFQIDKNIDEIVDKYIRFETNTTAISDSNARVASMTALFRLRRGYGAYITSKYHASFQMSEHGSHVDIDEYLKREIKSGLRILLLEERVTQHDDDNLKVWYIDRIIDQQYVFGTTGEINLLLPEPDMVIDDTKEGKDGLFTIYNQKWSWF